MVPTTLACGHLVLVVVIEKVNVDEAEVDVKVVVENVVAVLLVDEVTMVLVVVYSVVLLLAVEVLDEDVVLGYVVVIEVVVLVI